MVKRIVEIHAMRKQLLIFFNLERRKTEELLQSDELLIVDLIDMPLLEGD